MYTHTETHLIKLAFYGADTDTDTDNDSTDTATVLPPTHAISSRESSRGSPRLSDVRMYRRVGRVGVGVGVDVVECQLNRITLAFDLLNSTHAVFLPCTILYYEFGVDSSSRFLLERGHTQTNRQSHRVITLTQPTHRLPPPAWV